MLLQQLAPFGHTRSGIQPLGINGQGAVSALGSSCACPTAFIAFCPSWRLQHIQFHRHVQPAPSPNDWGCDLQDSTGLGVHPGQWSLLHPVLLLAGTHLALPGSGWMSVLRLKNPVGTGCRVGVNALHTTALGEQLSPGGGINGRYRSTECPRLRRCQPSVQWFSTKHGVPYLGGVLHYRMYH